jgi:hypothetical protein
MGMTGQTATTVAAYLMVELKAEREDKGEDKLDKRFAVADQVEVNGDCAILACRFGSLSHISPSVEMAIDTDETSGG